MTDEYELKQQLLSDAIEAHNDRLESYEGYPERMIDESQHELHFVYLVIKYLLLQTPESTLRGAISSATAISQAEYFERRMREKDEENK